MELGSLVIRGLPQVPPWFQLSGVERGYDLDRTGRIAYRGGSVTSSRRSRKGAPLGPTPARSCGHRSNSVVRFGCDASLTRPLLAWGAGRPLNPGDVVVGAFPGAPLTKARPAVELSTESYHLNQPDVIVGIVTA